MRLISVVMGTKSAIARANENQTLINFGFRFYESHRLYEGNKPLNEARIWKGANKTIPLGLTEDLYVTIPRRLYSDLKAVVNIDKKIIAPIAEHTKLGTVRVSLKDELIIEKDLVSLQAIDKGNMFQRVIDSALLMMEKSDNGK